MPARSFSSPRWLATAAGIVFALATSGCAWKTYVVTRSVRELSGAKTRLHVIAPLPGSLRTYRTIEVRPLRDLLGTRVPPSMERYLNDRITSALADLPSAPAVTRAAAPVPGVADGNTSEPSAATLVVDGFLDDYEAGTRALRVVELGFNHIAVTVRVRLRDKQSGTLLGAASITAEDDRATGTTRAAINNAADRIRGFVKAGYAR